MLIDEKRRGGHTGSHFLARNRCGSSMSGISGWPSRFTATRPSRRTTAVFTLAVPSPRRMRRALDHDDHGLVDQVVLDAFEEVGARWEGESVEEDSKRCLESSVKRSSAVFPPSRWL